MSSAVPVKLGVVGRSLFFAVLFAGVGLLVGAQIARAQAPPVKPPPPTPEEGDEEETKAPPPTKPTGTAGPDRPPPPVLLLSSDMDAAVELDGEPVIELEKDVVERIRVRPGEHLLQAFPKGIEGPTWKEAIKAPETGSVTAIIELEDIVKKWRESQEDDTIRFEVDEELDTVFDRETGLLWTQRVSPSMRWDDGETYCETLEYAGRSDWRLPKLDELSELYFPDHPAPRQETAREEGKLTIFGRVKGDMETFPRLIHEPFDHNSVSALWVESNEDRVACTFLGEFGCERERRKQKAGLFCVADPE